MLVEASTTKLGITIQNLREARGWSQAELARRAGMTSGQINRIEQGKSKNPTQNTLEALAGAFDLGVPALISLATGALPSAVNDLRIEGIPGEALARLAVMWSDLTDADREAVIEITRRIWEGRVPQVGEVVESPKVEDVA